MPVNTPIIDEDEFINRKVDEFGAAFDTPKRSWSWYDPIAKGFASLIHRFDSSKMEAERLQSLVGISDEQFGDAIASGRVKGEERLLGRLPKEQRDAYIQAEIDRQKSYQDTIDKAAGYFTPAPHAEPEGVLENIAYHGLKAVPSVLAGVGEYALLGPAGMGLTETYTGNQRAREEVYSNLRKQGKSIDEATAAANSIGGNLADIGVRGVTNFATMYALGKGVDMNSALSPFAQTARNIGTASLYSGTGAAGEQALTNYRSGIDNDVDELLKTGLIAGGTTAALGTVSALGQLRRLWNMQKQYNQNRGINVDWRELPPDDPRMLGPGDEPTPPDNMPPTPNGEALALPDPNNRWNEVTGRYGFEPDTPPEGIVNAIQYGQLSEQDARTMLGELGLSPEATQGMIDAAREARINDLKANTPLQINRMDKIQRPQVVRENLQPQVGVNRIDLTPPQVSVLDAMETPELIVGPEVNSMPLDNPLLQPPVTSRNMMDAIHTPPMSPALLNRTSQQTGQTGTGNAQIPNPNTTQTENTQGINSEEQKVEEELQGLNGLMPYIPVDSELAPVNQSPQLPVDTQQRKPAMSIDELREKLFDEMMAPDEPFILEDDEIQEQFEPNMPALGQTQTPPMLPMPQEPQAQTQAPQIRQPDNLSTDDILRSGNVPPALRQILNAMGITPQEHGYNVQTNNGLSQPQINTQGGLTTPEINTKGGAVLMNEPQISGLDTDNPLLQPPDYGKAGVTPAIKDYQDKIITSFNIDHMGDRHNVDITTGEYSNDMRRKEFGSSYISILNDEGQIVARYLPYNDLFAIAPEFKKTGWVRNIEETFRKNLPNILRNAGLLDSNGQLKPDGNEEYRINKYGYNPAWQPEEDEQTENIPQLMPVPDEEKKPRPAKTAKPVQQTESVPQVTPAPEEEKPKPQPKKETGGKIQRAFAATAGGKRYRVMAEDEEGMSDVVELIGNGFATKDTGYIYDSKNRKLFKPNINRPGLRTYTDDLNEHEKQLEAEINATRDKYKSWIEGSSEDNAGENIPQVTPTPEEEKPEPKPKTPAQDKKKTLNVSANGKRYKVIPSEDNNGEYAVIEARGTGWVDKGYAFKDGKLYKTTFGPNRTYNDNLDEQEKTLEQAVRSALGLTEATTPAPEPEPKTETKGEFDIAPYQKIAEQVKERVIDGLGITNNELLDMAAEAFGGTKGEGKFSPKDAYDALEMGLNLAIQEMRYRPSDLRKDFFSNMETFEKSIQPKLPTQTNRTEEQNEFQQFSTPPSIAYLVNWLANIRQGNIVLEPSAGMGGLAVFAKNAGAELILNELSDRRFALLKSMNFGTVFQENAEHIGNILTQRGYNTPDKRPSRVIMNPPFSSTAGRLQGSRDSRYAVKHLEAALSFLNTNGRLVAVLGKDRFKNEPTSVISKWIKHVKKKYNVRAVVTLDGSNYYKFGTTTGNTIIVIDKTTPTPDNGTYTGHFEHIEDMYEPLKAIRDDLPSVEVPAQDKAPEVKPVESSPKIKSNNPVKSMANEIIRMVGADPDRGYYKIAELRKSLRELEIDKNTFDNAFSELWDKGFIIPVGDGANANEDDFVHEGLRRSFNLFKVPDLDGLKKLTQAGQDTSKPETENKPAESKPVNDTQDTTETAPKWEDPLKVGRKPAQAKPKVNTEKQIQDNIKQKILNCNTPQYTDKEAEAIAHLFVSVMKYFAGHNKFDSVSSVADEWNVTIADKEKLRSEFNVKETNKLVGGLSFVTANRRAVIGLFNDAKKSHLLHEIAHIYLKQLLKLLRDMNYNDYEGIREDWYTITNSLGFEDLYETPHKRDFNMGQLEESFARAFEKFLFSIPDSLSPASSAQVMSTIKKCVRDSYNSEEDIDKEADYQYFTERLSEGFHTDENEITEDEYSEYSKVNTEGINNFFYKLLGLNVKESAQQTQPANSTPRKPKTSTDNETQTQTASETEAGSKSGLNFGLKSEKEKDEEKKADEQNEVKNTDTLDIQELNINSAYSSGIKGFKPHPGKLVESTAMSSVSLPPASYIPNLPPRIQKEGLLSDAQIEPVIYAGMAFRRMNQNGTRRGYYIGDGTGVGKGREISGIIMDQLRQGAGKGKAVWISDKHSLISDAKRDWAGIGNNPDDIFAQEKITQAKLGKQKEGIIFTAYSYMQNKARIEQLKKWLGEDFDGVIVLDECHNVNNVLKSKSSTGRTKQPSTRAVNTREFIAAFPKARVLYVSATGATEVKNLAMLDRLGLWGDNSTFKTAEDFVAAIEKGGTGAMELVARDLKAMGLFNSRSLSMDGVTFRTLEHKLTEHQKEQYDVFCQVWGTILRHLEVVIETTGQKKYIAEAQFWSTLQKFFNQIIIAFQTPAAIKDMQKQLEAGNSVLIQLTNTYASAQEQAKENATKNRAKNNDSNDDEEDFSYEELDLSPKATILKYLNSANGFPVYIMEEYTDEEGNVKTRIATDSEGNPIIDATAQASRDELVKIVESINIMPESPIDMIINYFGPENVAEITGRQERFQKGSNKPVKRSDTIRQSEINDFNNGRRRILIFSEKGGTGASYHASNDYKNRQKRIHYLLQPGWRADKAIQGLGRSHRSNEANQPEYVLVTTDIPGQKRFLSTIARRLEQLGALSSGERRKQTEGVFSEDDNLETDYVKYAIEDFFTYLDRGMYHDLPGALVVVDKLGLNPDMYTPGSKVSFPKVTKFLNRMLAVPLDLQKKIFAHFLECIKQRKASYEARGLLDKRPEDIRAKKISVIQEKTISANTEYGSQTKYVELELEFNMYPRKFDNVMATRGNGNNECYITDRGDVVIAVPAFTGQVDLESSDVEQVYTLYYVNPRQSTNQVVRHLLDNKGVRQIVHYTKLSESDARYLWNKQAEELPKTRKERQHMITGTLLPVLRKIQQILGTSTIRIQRARTQDGKSYLGMLIPDEKLNTILFQLGVNAKREKYTPERLLNILEKDGNIAKLEDNLRLKYSYVNGEKRLELLGVDMLMGRRLQQKGVILEIIRSKNRYFIPKGNNSILADILESWPVFDFEMIGQETDAYNSKNLYAVHPFFRPDPDDNPNINSTRYAFSDKETERRYQKSKKIDKPKLWHKISQAVNKLVKGFSDLPELSGDDSLIKAQELLRKLKRERKADVQETVQRLRAVLNGLNPDDFDLFSRAMALLDLKETRELDPEALLPWGYTPESLEYDYKQIMKDVDDNSRVADAIEKAEILNASIDEKLADAADKLQMFDIRDKLKRKHYFRHIVLEYYHQAGGSQPRPSMKNPQRRGYLKHRQGSDKDISSDWIIAMGEVWARMTGDIKIIDTLTKLRKEYDIIEDLKKQAFSMNYENALAQIMETLKDLPEFKRDVEAHRQLDSKLLHRQAQAVARLFKLAKKGDLPDGDNHEWLEFLGKFADAGQLENLDDKTRKELTRYIGWLASLEQKTNTPDNKAFNRARSTAQRFIRGDLNRQAGLKEILGSSYVQWQDLIPDDHDLWSPSDSRIVFSANTVSENAMMMAQEYIDELLGLPISELGNVLSTGADKQLWCIPTKLAETLDTLGKKQQPGMLAQIMRKGMNAFKRYILTTPANGRVFKYNWRNFFGDLEAVLQGNPAALWYVKRACKDLYDYMLNGGNPTGMLAEFVKRGGALTTEFASELENWQDLKEFAHLYEKGKTINPLKMGLNFLKGYMQLASTLTNYRESILRYAAFLAYYNQILANDGTAPFYGMSKPKEVEAMSDDIYDMAFKLANENLGAYDQVSQNTAWLRDNSIMTFISWLEVNFKRSVQMYKNIWSGNSYLEHWIKKHGQDFINHFTGGNGNGNKPPRNNNGSDWSEDDNDNWNRIINTLGKSPVYLMRFAITLAMAAPLMIILGMINWLNGENDEKLTPDVRNTPHLTLNTNQFTGEVLYLSRLGSSLDFFETIGLDSIGRDLKDLFDGKTTLLEIAGNIASGPVNKIISNVNPFAKAAIEMATGRRLYPDFRKPSSIRDNKEYLAQSLALDWYYDALTGKPHEPASHLASSLANTQKPEEAAYWYILAKKKEFQEKVLGNTYDGYTQSKKGEAMYNAKMAAAFGDRKLMRKYIKDYYRAGGDYEGIEQSANAMDPMFGLNEDEQLRFMKWLPKEERKILRKANKFFMRISARLGV